MMRIAVLVYGQYRELDIAIKSWGFKDKYYCDFYFSLWDKTLMKSRNTGEKVEIGINETMVKSYIPNAVVSLLNEKDFFDDTSNDNIAVNKSQRAIFHMMNCMKLVDQSKINYDNIILTRTDQFMSSEDNFDTFKTLNEENVIYGISEIWELDGNKFMMDTFLFAQYYTMKKFIENLPRHKDVGLHNNMPSTIINLNMFLKTIDKFRSTIVRPNCRNLHEDELNYDMVCKKCIEWGAND